MRNNKKKQAKIVCVSGPNNQYKFTQASNQRSLLLKHISLAMKMLIHENYDLAKFWLKSFFLKINQCPNKPSKVYQNYYLWFGKMTYSSIRSSSPLSSSSYSGPIFFFVLAMISSCNLSLNWMWNNPSFLASWRACRDFPDPLGPKISSLVGDV